MSVEKMREEFEAAFVERQVATNSEGSRGSAIHMLKRDGAFAKPPSYYELWRREQGMYDLYWVEMAWWAWQASRAALVIELPEPQPFEISAEESLDMEPEDYERLEARHGAQYSAYRKCRAAIEAAGVKVKP